MTHFFNIPSLVVVLAFSESISESSGLKSLKSLLISFLLSGYKSENLQYNMVGRCEDIRHSITKFKYEALRVIRINY